MGATNKLYFGDNLNILRDYVEDASVDLIYLDPPFDSSATYYGAFVAPPFRVALAGLKPGAAKSSGNTSYVWDFENRMTSATVSGVTTNFKYDRFGRRIEKISPSGTATIYAYDGDSIVGELNASGTSTARYAQGLGIDEPLARASSGSTYYYQADGLGSVTSLSDSAGARSNTYVYDSFGYLYRSTGGVTNPFQFTAREFDPETGLYYYRARYYDPTVGRFVSEDPLAFDAGINFYTYSANRPASFRDPMGGLSISADFTPQCLADLLAATKTLREHIKEYPSCNCWFRSHGLQLSLDQLLDSPLFTANYDAQGNQPEGEQDTKSYIKAGDEFNIFLTPLGCKSGPAHIAQGHSHTSSRT